MNWKSKLRNMLTEVTQESQSLQNKRYQRQQRIDAFFSLARESFKDIKDEIEKSGALKLSRAGMPVPWKSIRPLA